MAATNIQRQGGTKRFHLTAYGVGETKLLPGDSITCLNDGSHGNVLFFRGGYGMAVRSSVDGDMPFAWRVFRADEIRFLAIGLAIASGLGIEEKRYPNVVSGREDVVFTFVAPVAH